MHPWRVDERTTVAAEGHIHMLRSLRDLEKHTVSATDRDPDDPIVDDETWEVRYLGIDTTNWWLDKKMLVAPHWANGRPASWDPAAWVDAASSPMQAAVRSA
jgi:hypothetical protein